MPDYNTSSEFRWMKGFLLALVFAVGLTFLLALFVWGNGIMPIEAGFFKESLPVPIKVSSLGPELFSVEMDNFLVFQQYESLPPSRFPWVSKIYGAIAWLLFVVGLSLISTLRRNYFIAAAGAATLLLAFSGVNGLNIGSISSNYALLGLLAGTLLPTVLISFYAKTWGIWKRFAVLTVTTATTLATLIHLSPISDPVLWLSENASFVAAISGSLFLLHIGHVFVSGSSILLIRLNKDTGIKISWHIVLVFVLYFLLVLFTLLSQMGEVNLPFPTVMPGLLLLVCGVIGYFVLNLKIEQSPQAFDHPGIGQAFYGTGFAIVLWTWAFAQFNGNEPLLQFLTHVFLYGQVVLCVLFTLYLFANFADLLNTGKDIDKILFKPKFFAYFHMRIGAAMGLVVLVIFGEVVVGVQLSTASTNISADYYYQIDKPLEAAILYENSWGLYRKNDKAKNAAAHLRFDLGQTTAGMDNLVESFDYAPNVPSILMLASRLHQQSKIPDALFYLKKGLEYFPENPMLLNNLGLLQSRINRGEDAVALLERAAPSSAAASANLVAMMVKHRTLAQLPGDETKDVAAGANYLAFQNQNGDLAGFSIDMGKLPENPILRAAILRNQWSNHTNSDFESDLALMDSLVALPQMSFEELEFRETRVVRTLQDRYINETLKYLNGTTQLYPQSAGYYHGLAANILIGELDFEKASIDLLLAWRGGYEAILPQHLAILWFAGRESEAKVIQQQNMIDFPAWMAWNENGELVENELVRYFSMLSKLQMQMPEDFLPAFESLSDERLRAEFANFLLIHKIHWLGKAEFENLKKAILAYPESTWSEADLDAWFEFSHLAGSAPLSPKVASFFRPDLGLDRNAYWAPLIWISVKNEPDELKKYGILQESIQFNKDPKLWIAFVMQSRKIGLDNYGSSAMQEMQEWLTNSQIERLQMENL